MCDKKDNSLVGFEKLKLEIQFKAKNGIDFILAASITWVGIFLIWKLMKCTSYEKSVFTFIIGPILIPLALGFSKVLKTNWKIKDNPLQPLGLWLNFAQLIYAIITGAHLFPYSWFYDEIGYAVAALIISLGSMLIALIIEPKDIFYIPIFTALILLILGIWIFIRYQRLRKKMKLLETT